MKSHNSDEAKTWESRKQQLQITCRRSCKAVRCSEPDEEIFQIPAHQFETEHLVSRYFRIHNCAHVRGVIGDRIDPEFRGIATFGLGKKKLFRHACPAGVA